MSVCEVGTRNALFRVATKVKGEQMCGTAGCRARYTERVQGGKGWKEGERTATHRTAAGTQGWWAWALAVGTAGERLLCAPPPMGSSSPTSRRVPSLPHHMVSCDSLCPAETSGSDGGTAQGCLAKEGVCSPSPSPGWCAIPATWIGEHPRNGRASRQKETGSLMQRTPCEHRQSWSLSRTELLY